MRLKTCALAAGALHPVPMSGSGQRRGKTNPEQIRSEGRSRNPECGNHQVAEGEGLSAHVDGEALPDPLTSEEFAALVAIGNGALVREPDEGSCSLDASWVRQGCDGNLVLTQREFKLSEEGDVSLLTSAGAVFVWAPDLLKNPSPSARARVDSGDTR